MKRIVVVTLVLVAMIVTACSNTAATPAVSPGKTIEAPGGNYTLLSVTELHTMMATKDFTFVNVHIPYEGEIDKTDLFIPYNEIANNLSKLPAKDARIVVYCKSGGMSEQAAKVLVSLGYTHVFDVEGGFTAWKDAGYALLNKTT
jgi:rhodanese-related sulfurtransferase